MLLSQNWAPSSVLSAVTGHWDPCTLGLFLRAPVTQCTLLTVIYAPVCVLITMCPPHAPSVGIASLALDLLSGSSGTSGVPIILRNTLKIPNQLSSYH